MFGGHSTTLFRFLFSFVTVDDKAQATLSEKRTSHSIVLQTLTLISVIPNYLYLYKDYNLFNDIHVSACHG